MIRRPRRTIPAVIVAVILLAAAVVVTWACVQILLGQTPIVDFTVLAGFAATFTWNNLAVLITGGVLAVLGLILLVTAIRPGRPTVLALAARPDPDTSLRAAAAATAAAHSWDELDRATPSATSSATAQPDTGATRRSIAAALTAAAADVDGVDRAAVTLSGRVVTATVRTSLRSSPELEGQVRDAVTVKLDDIGLAHPLRVRVRAATTSSPARSS